VKLNGVGLRKKAIFKVYVAGLYVEAPSKDAAAILAADAARIVKMQYLRSVDKASITGAFRRGSRTTRRNSPRNRRRTSTR